MAGPNVGISCSVDLLPEFLRAIWMVLDVSSPLSGFARELTNGRFGGAKQTFYLRHFSGSYGPKLHKRDAQASVRFAPPNRSFVNF